jgi:hemerythrin
MEWQESLKTGIAVIDAQHRQLFATCKDFDQTVNQNPDPAQVQNLLDILHYYAIRHFAMEEKYMKECNYPEFDAHRKIHLSFTDNFSLLATEFKDSGLTSSLVERLKKDLSDWIVAHICGIDQEFAAYRRDGQEKE